MSLRFENLAKRYGDKVVFEDLNLELPSSGIVGLSAPSGTGKTTLLKIAAGLIAPDRGQVLGRPVRISMLFEDDVLLPWLSAAENVTLVGADAAAVKDLFGELGLDGLEGRSPCELSGGQRRRVALARALARPQSELFLLDEPSIRLDEEAASLACAAIQAHCGEVPTLVASHDARVLSLCETVIELDLRR